MNEGIPLGYAGREPLETADDGSPEDMKEEGSGRKAEDKENSHGDDCPDRPPRPATNVIHQRQINSPLATTVATNAGGTRTSARREGPVIPVGRQTSTAPKSAYGATNKVHSDRRFGTGGTPGKHHSGVGAYVSVQPSPQPRMLQRLWTSPAVESATAFAVIGDIMVGMTAGNISQPTSYRGDHNRIQKEPDPPGVGLN